jgi:hypothetical protein
MFAPRSSRSSIGSLRRSNRQEEDIAGDIGGSTPAKGWTTSQADERRSPNEAKTRELDLALVKIASL